MVRVTAASSPRRSVAGVVCLRPGDRAHLFYRLHVWRGRTGERRSFAWWEYRNLIVAVHQQLGGPVVWVWDNLNVHLTGQLAEFAAANRTWLTVFRLPAYAPDLNPAEGVWSLLKRSMENLATTSLDHLVGVMKRHLKRIQCCPRLVERCLTQTGLCLEEA